MGSRRGPASRRPSRERWGRGALMFRRLVLIVVLVSGLELIRKSLWS
jgi:hypothetical protein